MDQGSPGTGEAGPVGRAGAIDHEAGEVPLSLDDVQAVELPGATRRVLYCKAIKRRLAGRIRQWLNWLKTVDAENAAEQEAEVFRCADDLARILRLQLVDWAGFVDDAGREVPFDVDVLDDLLDDGEVITAAAQLYAASMSGASQKKRSGSPLRLSTQDAVGSLNPMGSPSPGPSSNPKPSGASGAMGGIPGGGDTSMGMVGPPPPSSADAPTTPKPPPPLPAESD